jgi:phosphatidylserine/phosphatidylglycerophosphate/cardiolipin synthase-like enzyme
MGNAAVPYIYGKCAFEDIRFALATATQPTHRIYLLGWWVDPNTKLTDGPPPILLKDLLSNTKAAIRGMFWADPLNVGIATFLNGLPNGAAILDHKLPFLRLLGKQTARRGGVHHQKLLVVDGEVGLIAFLGGMDINNTRVQVSPDGKWPLHDVHVRITGEAARALLDVFSQRWLDHPDAPALDTLRFRLSSAEVKADFAKVRRNPIASPPLSVTRDLTHPVRRDSAIAIGRTYANLKKFTGTEEYDFTSGEETAWNLVSNGVKKAQRFIYIEDQYFISRRLKEALRAKLKEPQFIFLLILMGDSSAVFDDFPGPSVPLCVAARNEIRDDFSKEDPGRKKWRMFSLKPGADAARRQWCGSYVHSKTHVYDDDCAIIGSANADDRGYTFDTEVVACITDDPQGRLNNSHFARDLRIALWHKHLGVAHNDLADWSKALQFWLKPPPSAMVIDNSNLENDATSGKPAILRDDVTANRFWGESVDPDADLLP